MKKNSTKGYVILCILLALVCVIVFAIPTPKTETFWIAFVFTVVAFVAQIGIWKAAFKAEEPLKSKFLGFPIASIGTGYLIAQIIALAVFLLQPTSPVWIAIIACASITGISAVCIIAVDVGRQEIKQVEIISQKKVFYTKALQADVEMLAEKEGDETVKVSLLQLAEKIRFSDPISHDQLADLERKIQEKTDILKTATEKKELISELNSLLTERNKKTKLLK